MIYISKELTSEQEKFIQNLRKIYNMNKYQDEWQDLKQFDFEEVVSLFLAIDEHIENSELDYPLFYKEMWENANIDRPFPFSTIGYPLGLISICSNELYGILYSSCVIRYENFSEKEKNYKKGKIPMPGPGYFTCFHTDIDDLIEQRKKWFEDYNNLQKWAKEKK